MSTNFEPGLGRHTDYKLQDAKHSVDDDRKKGHAVQGRQ